MTESSLRSEEEIFLFILHYFLLISLHCCCCSWCCYCFVHFISYPPAFFPFSCFADTTFLGQWNLMHPLKSTNYPSEGCNKDKRSITPLIRMAPRHRPLYRHRPRYKCTVAAALLVAVAAYTITDWVALAAAVVWAAWAAAWALAVVMAAMVLEMLYTGVAMIGVTSSCPPYPSRITTPKG